LGKIRRQDRSNERERQGERFRDAYGCKVPAEIVNHDVDEATGEGVLDPVAFSCSNPMC